MSTSIEPAAGAISLPPSDYPLNQPISVLARSLEPQFTTLLDPDQSLEMERRHLWVRLAVLVLPVVIFLAFGPPALSAAFTISVSTLASFAFIRILIWRWPAAVRHGQLTLRL